MNSVYQSQNSLTISKLEGFIRLTSKEHHNNILKIINSSVDWSAFSNSLNNNSVEIFENKFQNIDTPILIKCLILGKIFNLTDYQLPFEIAENNSYKNFLGLKSLDSIPKIKTIVTFRKILDSKGDIAKLFDSFYEHLIDKKDEIFAIINENDEQFHLYAKKSELEHRINDLYEKKLSLIFSDLNEIKVKDLKDKLMKLKNRIENISDKESDFTPSLYHKLLDIEQNINNVDYLANDLKSVTNNRDLNNKLYLKMFDTFYKNLDENGIGSSQTKDDKTNPESENIQNRKFKYADIMISQLNDGLNNLNDVAVNEIKGKTNIISDYLTDIPKKEKIEIKEEIDTCIKNREPIVITPKLKKEGIFNDENLTEDYELGYRFFQIGFKTGFFNVKLDSNNESTRISTAEFFPNTFWTSVKQRSRWIAGICLQNWKAHQWKGNLTTKYFLFRDRKSLFSFFSAFFSNIIFMYILYSIFCNVFHVGYILPIVGFSSVLWYLMVANLVFMLSRACHRFIFTYNWYGFKYAFFSFFRLILDTSINFFAIIRAVKVFQQTKKKVVWDATSHY